MSGYGNAAGLLYQNGFLTGNFQMDTDGDEYSSDEDDEEHERNVSRDVERSKKERLKSTKFSELLCSELLKCGYIYIKNII